MSRQTVRDRLHLIKQKNGEKMTRYKFLYRNKTILKRKFHEVYFWLILVDAIDGSTTLFEWTTRRAEAMTPKQWATWFKDGYKNYKKPGVKIFSENVLEGVNNNSSHDWQFARLAGFGQTRVF